MSVVESCNMQL